MKIQDSISIPKSKIPEGVSGNWRVERFSISEVEASFFNLRQVTTNQSRFISPGCYTKLTCNGSAVMSDTPSEVREHQCFWAAAKGNVLINGLGLGLIARGVLLKTSVTKVIVNEISKDVISLVSSFLIDEFGDRIEINNTDAFVWKPNKNQKFHAIWHDIWGGICKDNYSEMKFLHRRYGRWLASPAKDMYNSSWSLEYMRNTHRVYPYFLFPTKSNLIGPGI